jgi:hypothetical protein
MSLKSQFIATMTRPKKSPANSSGSKIAVLAFSAGGFMKEHWHPHFAAARSRALALDKARSISNMHRGLSCCGDRMRVDPTGSLQAPCAGTVERSSP